MNTISTRLHVIFFRSIHRKSCIHWRISLKNFAMSLSFPLDVIKTVIPKDIFLWKQKTFHSIFNSSPLKLMNEWHGFYTSLSTIAKTGFQIHVVGYNVTIFFSTNTFPWRKHFPQLIFHISPWNISPISRISPVVA